MPSWSPRAPIEIHAHRGASEKYPENTMAAFLAARELGAHAIEFDVHVTADGHPVVIHDYDLSRTTTGEGFVHERDLAYIRSLSAGSWFRADFEEERVPLLSEVLALGDVGFELEIKGLPSDRLVDAVITGVRDAGAVARTEFTGHHHVSAMRVQQRLPGARLGLFAPRMEAWMTDRLFEQIVASTATCGGFEVVHVLPALLHKVSIERLHDLGLRVHSADPVSETEVVDAVERGVDQMTINDVELAVRVLESLPGRGI